MVEETTDVTIIETSLRELEEEIGEPPVESCIYLYVYTAMLTGVDDHVKRMTA
jgi:hypothetical protein